MTRPETRRRAIALPLLRREWGIVRRALLGCTVLTTLGVAFAFLTFDAENRYRSLADPTMLRSVLLPGGLAAGTLCAWLAFVQEMRSGTWDGWLLLPASRTALVAAKLSVGLAGAVCALLVPSVLLWVGLHVIRDVGGPIIHFHELLFRSSFTQGALVAMVAYLATASAASMAREGHVAFLAPLLLPLAAFMRFFGSDTGSRALPLGWETHAAAAASALMMSLLAVHVLRAGRAPRPIESTLRALLVMPMAGVVMLLVASVGFGVVQRATSEPPSFEPEGDWREDDPTLGIDGTIAPQRPNHTLSTYGMVGLDRLDASPESRLRTPFSSSFALQTFLEQDRPVLRAFDPHTGRELGCVGPDGLREGGGCRPFDGVPRTAFLGDFEVVLTPSSLHALYDSGRVVPLGRGAVHGAVSMELESGGGAVAVAIDDDLLLVLEPEAAVEPSVEPGGEPPVETRIACHDLVRPGQRIESVAVRDDFVGVSLSSRDRDANPDAGDLVICRGGVVTQRVPFEDEAFPVVPPRWGRGDVEAMVAGPVIDRVYRDLRGKSYLVGLPAERPWFRLAGSVTSSVVCVLALALVLWRMRRTFPWWVMPGLVLGPGYVLSCALLLWLRPRWASVVGGA